LGFVKSQLNSEFGDGRMDAIQKLKIGVYIIFWNIRRNLLQQGNKTIIERLSN
jgi:hypothetical protein